ncbi:MAG: NepR family anti-sigma factor [Sphingomicrobium sp.]
MPEGDERLSGTNRGDGKGPGETPGARHARIRKDKASPVGRALRTVYDDTLREEVPDDFMDLLRKLD